MRKMIRGMSSLLRFFISDAQAATTVHIVPNPPPPFYLEHQFAIIIFVSAVICSFLSLLIHLKTSSRYKKAISCIVLVLFSLISFSTLIFHHDYKLVGTYLSLRVYAENGNARAQKALGELYITGSEVSPQNFEKAYFWLSLARQSKDFRAGSTEKQGLELSLQRAASLLTSKQVDMIEAKVKKQTDAD